MSAEQRHADSGARGSTRTRTDSDPASTPVPTPSIDATDGDHPSPMASDIEEIRLRAQVAALERELAASERRRQAIVDQYERVLEERDRSFAESRNVENRSDDGLRSIVRTVVETLR